MIKLTQLILFTGLLLISESVFAENRTMTEGNVLYLKNCIYCHQADAIGKPGIAPSLINPEFLSISSDKLLMSTIRDGRPGTAMIPFAHLGMQKISAIVGYLRSHEKLPDISTQVQRQAPANGDVKHGQRLFNDICATCHGPEGDGYLAGGSGTAIGKRGFLAKVSDGYIRETVKHGRSNTRMLSFQGPAGLADLSDQEIDDIISYLRTLN